MDADAGVVDAEAPLVPADPSGEPGGKTPGARGRFATPAQ